MRGGQPTHHHGRQETNALITDRVHTPQLYEWDRLMTTGVSMYLRETDPKRLRPVKDTVQVRSLLCSTIMTQNQALSKVGARARARSSRGTPPAC